MTVKVRFAPSPTGYLHIGGARTALFNYLFARHHGGQYLLRIEDTDHARSTKEAIDTILDGLGWLGLEADEPPILQSQNLDRHKQVADELIEKDMAYRCYATPEQLALMREQAKKEGRTVAYDRRWRDKTPDDWPKDTPYVIRVKMPLDGGMTTINDLVQGGVSIQHEQLDDFVILRADGTPTYMLSVVVDDFDMGITHIIRGNDHFTNSFRQYHLYKAAGWPVPEFAHIPLIHGDDGKKLSKRHGALSVGAYREMGYLPEALNNYLLRLGWSHGDDEIISKNEAIDWFELSQIGRSPSQFDKARLNHINGHYMKQRPADELIDILIKDHLQDPPLDQTARKRIERGLPALLERADEFITLKSLAMIYIKDPNLNDLSAKQQKIIVKGQEIISQAIDKFQNISDWQIDEIHNALDAMAQSNDIGFGKVAQPLRASLSGRDASPGLLDISYALGKDEAINRLKNAMQWIENKQENNDEIH